MHFPRRIPVNSRWLLIDLICGGISKVSLKPPWEGIAGTLGQRGILDKIPVVISGDTQTDLRKL